MSSFDRIALSLSGGGFRASAYALGTLKALYLLGLLDRVHMLSTASGGTITGAYYALRRKRGDGFAAIYADFYDLLEHDQLLPHALARWEQSVAAGNGRDKLIQAFADTYCQDLYGEAQLDIFWEEDAEPTAPFHLQSLIFGATELYSGLTFRFQHGAFLPAPKGNARDSYVVGNGNVWLKARHARQLRLGDVVAASSCFPGGFEPLVMPDDFLPGHSPGMLRGSNAQVPKRVALLDGGIYDNQGIESLLLANERNRKYAAAAQQHLSPQQAALLQPTTLFLIADVSGADTNLYPAPASNPLAGPSPTLRQAFGLGLGGVGLLGLAAGTLAYYQYAPFWGGLLAGLGLVGLLVMLGLWWGWQQLGRVLRGVGPQLPGWVLPRLGNLSVSLLRRLLAVRGASTLALLTSVFMRRVRSLNYEQVYRQSASRPTPEYTVLSSLIGRIASDYERRKDKPKKKTATVQDQLAAVYPTVCRAQQMPTTLWWQHDKHRLPAIVASAEITLYYQLLRRFEKAPPVPDSYEAEVQRRAQLLWEAYQAGGTDFLVPLAALDALRQPNCTAEQLVKR